MLVCFVPLCLSPVDITSSTPALYVQASSKNDKAASWAFPSQLKLFAHHSMLSSSSSSVLDAISVQ